MIRLEGLTISRVTNNIYLLGIREIVTWERMGIRRSSTNLVLIPASA